MFNLIPFPTEQLGPELEAVAHEIHQETGVAISTIATALLKNVPANIDHAYAKDSTHHGNNA